jgi:Methyltransferase domain
MKPPDVVRASRVARDIEGWLSPDAAKLLGLLDEAQQEGDVNGHLFEIGVHHGRSALLLIAFARTDEHLGVCDLFGSQGENASGSGAGDRETFAANVARLAPTFSTLDIFESSSDQLDAARVSRPVRMFHVDGGHLAEETLGDLRFAASVLGEQGVIVLDDAFEMDWPGVTEGLYEFLREESGLVPLVMGFGKLVLCPRNSRDYYIQYVIEHASNYFPTSIYTTKQMLVAGHSTTLLQVYPALLIPNLDLKIARFRARARSSQALSLAARAARRAWKAAAPAIGRATRQVAQKAGA